MPHVKVSYCNENNPVELYDPHPQAEQPFLDGDAWRAELVITRGPGDTPTVELFCRPLSSSTLTPPEVYLGYELRFSIPLLTARAANRLLREVTPYANTIAADWHEEYDDQHGRRVAVLGAAAEKASERIARLCDRARFRPVDIVYVWDLKAATGSDEEEIEEFGITATTSDKTLQECVTRRLQELADVSGGHEAVVVPGLFEYLQRLRDRSRAINA